MRLTSNIVQELFTHEAKVQDKLLQEVKDILDNDAKINNIFTQEPHLILSETSIKKICLKYRMRFLDISFFKGNIPESALKKLETIREKYDLGLEDLKIIAPGELFNLEPREKDPILLARLTDGHYLFIDKWGNDFNLLRVIKSFPLRNIYTMVACLGVLSLTIAYLFSAGITVRWDQFLFGWLTLWIAACIFNAFVSISASIYPTNMIWKSKFLD